MFKKSVLILLMLPLTYASFANSERIAAYYRIVHEANVQICKGHLEQASNFFDTAFKQWPPFFLDLNNAVYAEVNLNKPDTSKVIGYLKLIQKKGICVHKHYKLRAKFLPFVKMMDEVECNQVANPVARKLLEDCIKSDQDIRHKSQDSLGDMYHPAILPQMSAIDLVNYQRVDSIFYEADRQNISIEEMIGYDAGNDAFVVLLHNSGWSRDNSPLLVSLCKKGLLESGFAALRMDNFCGVGRFNTANNRHDCFETSYGSGILTLTYSTAFISIPGTREKINARRKEIYLADVVDEAKIRAYAWFNRKQGIEACGLDIISMSPERMRSLQESFVSQHKPFIIYHEKEDFDFDRK